MLRGKMKHDFFVSTKGFPEIERFFFDKARLGLLAGGSMRITTYEYSVGCATCRS